LTSQSLAQKGRWLLSQEAFDGLLSAMDSDRGLAAEKYEAIRTRLLRFFAWQGLATPEDCADETLNIVARRLSEGETIQNISGYCSGVARVVLLEHRRKQLGEEMHRHTLAGDPAGDEDSREDRERDLRALERCLDALQADSREMILAYYCTDGDGLMGNRRNLAKRLGLPLNALRIRAHRVRSQLERCVKQALEASRD
jgi:DNA-directed RNA polymerase specialized sigma24 family protein